MEKNEAADAEVLEIDCEVPDQDDAGDAIQLDESDLGILLSTEELPEGLLVAGLGPLGGGWGGAQHPVDRAQAIGRRNGLQVTSRKRSSGNSTSDHHTSQRRSDAVDLSNGVRPTPEMDRTAKQIAALLGVRNWQGGKILTWRGNGYRVQLIYKTEGHFNHVHVGVRVGG